MPEEGALFVEVGFEVADPAIAMMHLFPTAIQRCGSQRLGSDIFYRAACRRSKRLTRLYHRQIFFLEVNAILTAVGGRTAEIELCGNAQ